MRGSNFQNKTMNTPKEPSAVERAIEAQRVAYEAMYGTRARAEGHILKPEQLAALFAVQNLYAQLEKKHGEALSEIASLWAELARFYAAENKQAAIDAALEE